MLKKLPTLHFFLYFLFTFFSTIQLKFSIRYSKHHFNIILKRLPRKKYSKFVTNQNIMSKLGINLNIFQQFHYGDWAMSLFFWAQKFSFSHYFESLRCYRLQESRAEKFHKLALKVYLLEIFFLDFSIFQRLIWQKKYSMSESWKIFMKLER